MSLDYAILGFLSEKPASGYDLKRRCFASNAMATLSSTDMSSDALYWNADQAQIYRTLDRLEQRALVKHSRMRQGRRPERLIYAITDAGKHSLIDWLATPEPLPPTRDSFALKLRFSYALKPQQRYHLILMQLEEHRTHLAQLKQQQQLLKNDTTLASPARTARLDAVNSIVVREQALIAALEKQLSTTLPAREAGA